MASAIDMRLGVQGLGKTVDAKYHRDQFNKLFRVIAPYHHRYDVFRDFVLMASASLHNGIRKDMTLENQYLDTIKRYEPKDQKLFPELLGHVVMGLEAKPHDFLGSVYMELELGNKGTGQFFTPYEVSYMMAKMLVGDSEESCLKGKPFLTFQEPACGAGSMVIAYSEAMKEVGINPQQKLWVHCIDIDPLPARMCYVQLSLLYIPAIVQIGNGLFPKPDDVMLRTVAHYLGGWEGRIAHHFNQSEAPPADASPEPPVEPGQKPAAPALPVLTPSTLPQMDLFAL